MHIHSNYSDGMLTVGRLCRILSKNNIRCTSLTDHDTIAGVEKMMIACQKYNITNIAGTEMSCFNGEVEIHILAYGIDYKNPALKAVFKSLRKARVERAEQILQRLKQHGFEIDIDEVLKYSKLMVSRSHIAQAIAKKYGHKNSKEVFDSLLAEGKCCFVPNQGLTPKQIIDLIHDYGGYAVLAHPYRLKCNDDKKYLIIKELKLLGLDGLEVFYKSNNTERMQSWARECGLFMTAGSDFHNAADTIYSQDMPIDFLQSLREGFKS